MKKKTTENNFPKGEIVIYKTKDGQAKLEVNLREETVWLAQKQIADLFGIERSVIAKHLRNVFRDSELSENSVCAIFAHTAADGKTYQTQYYNHERQQWNLKKMTPVSYRNHLLEFAT